MKKFRQVTLFLLILSIFSPLNAFASKKEFDNSSGLENKKEISKWEIAQSGYKITRGAGEEKNGLVNVNIDGKKYVSEDALVTGLAFDGKYRNGSEGEFDDVELTENSYKTATGKVYYREKVEKTVNTWRGSYTYTTWENKSKSFNVILPKTFSKPEMTWDKDRYNEDKRADILAELKGFKGQLDTVKAYTENVYGVFEGHKDEDLASEGNYVRFKEVEIEYDKKIDGKATIIASGYAPFVVKHENPKAIKVKSVKSNIAQSSRDANDDIFHRIITTIESGKNYDKANLPLYSIQPKQFLEGAGIERKEYEKIYDSLEKEEQLKKIDEWKLKKTFGHGVDSQASDSIKVDENTQEAYWIFNRLPMPEKDTIFYIRQKNDKGDYARRQEELEMKVSKKKNMKIEARYEKEKGIINRFNVYFSNVPPNSKVTYSYNSSQSATDQVLADKVGKIRIPFYLDNDPKSVTFQFKNQYYNDFSITIDFPGGLSKERRDAIRKVNNSDRALSYNEKNEYFEQIDKSKTASEINSINSNVDTKRETFRTSTESENLNRRKNDLLTFIEESKFLSNEKKADFKERVNEASTITELYTLEDTISKYVFDLTKEKVRDGILELFDYPSKDIDINSIGRIYTVKSLEEHLNSAKNSSDKALFQFKKDKMELNEKISKAKFTELEKNELYLALEKIKNQEELNKFKEDVEKKIEALEMDLESYKEEARKLINENKVLTKEDKKYYLERLERAKTNLEVKTIIDEVNDGGAESLSILMDKKKEAKLELDKLDLRENSKKYYIRLIDSAVSLEEVDEILALAKENPDGSKILLKEKEIAKNKLKDIKNLLDEDIEKYSNDIYYAMEVRELDEILSLAENKGIENLDKAKTDAKMKIIDFKNLTKEDVDKLSKEIESTELIEDVNKILEKAKELDEQEKFEKEISEKKKELIEKLKELKYLTELKLSAYTKGIENAKTYELAEEIYNKAVDENTKAEELAQEEDLKKKLEDKKIEAINIVNNKELSEMRKNLLINEINKSESIEEIDKILDSDILKNAPDKKEEEPTEPITPEEPAEEKDFSKDKFRTIQEDVVIEKIQEIAEYEIGRLDITDEEKEEMKEELSKVETASEMDAFIEKYQLDIMPIIRTVALNTVGVSESDDSREKALNSFIRNKIYRAEKVEDIKNIFRKIM